MIRAIRPLLPLLALLVTGGCFTARGGELSPQPTDPAARRAHQLRAECRGGSACYGDSLLAVLRGEGLEPALTTLERLGELDPAVQRDGHMYVHALGLAAYTTPEAVGATFRRCTAVFQSGCYHGVIQAYFADLAGSGGSVDSATINALCHDYRGDASERWLLFQCVHGAGHGLTMLYAHHLPRALAGCDLLTDPWERESCYGGAFMENVVQATTPHHALGRPHASPASPPGGEHAGHHEHADHGAQAEPEFRALDPADPLYPCTALEARYLGACYQMQTSAILHFNGYDVAATARACQRAPDLHRGDCYQSLGRDISAMTLQDHAAARRLCRLAGEEHASRCHVGYAKNLIDLSSRVEPALDYCRELPAGDGKRSCYRAVGEEIWVLTDDPERERRYCGAAEEPYRGTCRAAARLASGPGEESSAGPDL